VKSTRAHATGSSLLRRWGPAGNPLGQLEGRLYGAAGARYVANLGGTLRAAACPQALQFAHDPFERADITSNIYWDWLLENAILALTASALVTQFLETFKEFPPRQEAATFTIDQAMAKLEAALTEGR
jgi:hypothetical protein